MTTLIAFGAYSIFSICKLKREVKTLGYQNKYIFKSLSGGIHQLPKAYGNLRDRQLRLTQALVEFDKFATKHNIEYWLDYGTLLGAERHDGFIPWDDDLDIAMTEESLNKLRKIVAEDESLGIKLVPANNNDTQALWFFQTKHGTVDIFSHVFIAKEDFAGQASYTYWMHYLRPIAGRSFVDSHIIARLDGLKQVPDMNNLQNYLVTMRVHKRSGSSGLARSAYAANDVFPLKKHVFEGHQFPVPNNAAAVLMVRYGKNYNDLPDDFGYSSHLGVWQ